MNPILEILKELKIDQDKIKELFKTLTENPMMAMGLVQKLGIPTEKFQKIMGLIMTQPGLIKEAVEELGLDFSAVEKAKEKLKDSLN
ncbi:MAG: hypothetical protein ACI9QD_000071 [Thermoproteota archaeon]|jgi:hypothetical protein